MEALLSIGLREQGVRVTADHPRVLEWVQAGYTLEHCLKGVAIARQSKGPDAPIHANYLDRILRDPQNWTPGRNGNGQHEPRKYKTAEQTEDEYIERFLREGKSEEEICAMDDYFALTPNLAARVRAIRQRLDDEQH